MNKLELSQGTLDMLSEAWQANALNMADDDRPLARLETLLYNTPQTVWYQGPGRSWIYFTGVLPNVGAYMHALNLDGWAAVDVPLVRKILLGAVQDYNIHRLTIALPEPAKAIQKAAQKLGFRLEGTMRESCIYNEKHVDVQILGQLRSEMFSPLPKSRRRRRSRRKKWAVLDTSYK